MRWPVVWGTTLAMAIAVPVTNVGAQYRHEPAPAASGSGGAVATADSVATRAALETLREGGNAIDAAVVAAAVLGVTDPFSCGIGGGGFIVAYSAADRRVTTIDHREESPAAMRPDSFMRGGAPLPFGEARYSGLSAGVPGTVAGWAEALRKYGTLSLGEALEPAIDVARRGFVIDEVFFDQVQANVPWFDDITSSRALFLDPDGTPKDVGTVFRNPDLARTYERIAGLGAKGFYRGVVAAKMVDAVRDPPLAPGADHVWRPGLMTKGDLEAYEAIERTPTRVGYRGLDVFGMGPPSSGGSTVGEALNILEGFALSPADRTQALHLLLEASRFSFADRNAYLGDPEFSEIPLRGLLSDGFATERRALIDPQRAANRAVVPGNPWPYDGGSGSASRVSRTATPGVSTTHLTTADAEGNVVAYTFTIESTGGNGVVVPGRGFLLNNELTDFDYNLNTHRGHPNSPDGGKRPRSSMAPTLVLRDGVPVLGLGSPGGSTIITTVLQMLVERLDLGRSLPDALAAPRATQRNGAITLVEPAFRASPEGQALAADPFRHAFGTVGEIGAATAVELLGDGRMVAAAEPTRRGGGGAGVVGP